MLKVLNLGCGFKTSDHGSVVNIDQSVALRVRSSPVLRPFARFIFRGQRGEAYRKLPTNIVPHDLTKGIPADDNSVDVVFFSHVLEHLDRDVAPLFLSEVHRVLLPGGSVRVVVPDLGEIIERYSAAYSALRRDSSDNEAWASYDLAMDDLLEQSVRREASGTSQQPRFRRLVERAALGGARRRGETHQWMYDEFSLRRLLVTNGFIEVARKVCGVSEVVGWQELGLEVDVVGAEYKPGSLYMEGQKPR